MRNTATESISANNSKIIGEMESKLDDSTAAILANLESGN